jgi:hypothetical protein
MRKGSAFRGATLFGWQIGDGTLVPTYSTQARLLTRFLPSYPMNERSFRLASQSLTTISQAPLGCNREEGPRTPELYSWPQRLSNRRARLRAAAVASKR